MILKYRITIRYNSLNILCISAIFFNGARVLRGPEHPYPRGFTIIHGRNPQDEWAVRSRELYLTTHTMHKRQTSMSPSGFKPAIPSSERPQTDALDRVATDIGPSTQYPRLSIITVLENLAIP